MPVIIYASGKSIVRLLTYITQLYVSNTKTGGTASHYVYIAVINPPQNVIYHTTFHSVQIGSYVVCVYMHVGCTMCSCVRVSMMYRHI